MRQRGTCHDAQMPRRPLPPVAVVIGFIDCINRGDVEGLGALMAEEHRLIVLDEPPVVGRDENVRAWRGYASSFPNYVIYPRALTVAEDRVAVLGSTTGSHLGLADDVESQLSVIWIAEVEDGAVRVWQIVEDSPESRVEAGFALGQ
jgi:hypothetical protein